MKNPKQGIRTEASNPTGPIELSLQIPKLDRDE
jgi:hypothetical protein